MRSKFLPVLLVLSLLLNVVGIVYFVSFPNGLSSFKKVQKERNQTQNLQVTKDPDQQARARIKGLGLIKRTFVSHVDGAKDVYGYIPPLIVPGTTGYILVVYLHYLGSDFREPFILPSVQKSIAQTLRLTHKNVCILSCNYRNYRSWGNDLAIADINQNIRATLQALPISKIILMGTSMGGCTALNYATEAPPDIKCKICGVVSVEGAGDLSKLYSLSKSMRTSMITAFHGKPEQVPQTYKAKSFLRHIEALPLQTRVAVVSAKADTLMPSQLQKEIIDALRSKHVPVKLVEVEGNHGMPDASVYLECFDWVNLRNR